MEHSIRCRELVAMVVEEATEKMLPSWKINEMHYDILKEYCDAIDVLVSECDGEFLEAEAEDHDMTVTVRMGCACLTVSSSLKVFYELIRRTVSFGFSASESGELVVELVFPSVWERAGR